MVKSINTDHLRSTTCPNNTLELQRNQPQCTPQLLKGSMLIFSIIKYLTPFLRSQKVFFKFYNK